MQDHHDPTPNPRSRISRALFGPINLGGGRVQLYGCSPGCLLLSLLVSVVLTVALNLILNWWF